MIVKAAPQQSFFNVFLSYSSQDQATAEVIQQKLTDAGLTVFDAARLAPDADVEAALRQAMWESASLVVIGTPVHVNSPQLLFEIGAAWGLRKPVFLLWNSARLAEIPVFLRKFRVQPLSETDALIRELVELSQPLSEQHQQTLKKVYERLGIPADQLLTDPTAADQLTQDFRQASGAAVTEETLLRELLRLRKRGLLPNVKKSKR